MSFLYPITTLSFAYPIVFLLPIVALMAVLIRENKSRAIHHPQVRFLRGISPSIRLRIMRPARRLLSFLIVILLTIAAARPQRVTVLNELRDSRNIMLAVDVSKSMTVEDFGDSFGRISRMEAVKRVVADFVRARTDDRLGLVVFGSNAYLQAPLTMDHSIIESLIQRISAGMAGDGTAIGDGLGVSLKRIEELPSEARAIVLITDGVSNSGKVSPLQAAKIAADLKIKVHTVGIGSDSSVVVRGPGGFFSSRMIQQGEFDEATLKKIAELTGGVYFHAKDFEGLKQIYAEIDKLESTESEEPSRQKVEEFFAMYAVAALFIYSIYLLVTCTIFSRIP